MILDKAVVVKYCLAKRAEKKANEQRKKADDAKEESEKQHILETLYKRGVENVWTNGYVFEFSYKGYSVKICNQTDRFVGSIHKTVHSMIEKKMLSDMTMLRHTRPLLFDEISEKYKYEWFCSDGPVELVLKKVDEKRR